MIDQAASSTPSLSQSYPEGAALVLGASGGLGAACAAKIAEQGNNLALTFHNNSQTVQQLSQDAHQVVVSTHPLDVSNAEQVANMVAEVVVQHGRINCLVYAIGTNIAQPLVAEVSPQQWSEIMTQDLQGFMNVVQPVLLHMRENGGGSIVHVSSAGLGKTPPRDSLSVAPKAAIDALMRTIAVEEGMHNIRANSVGVGVIEAGIFKRLEAQGVFDDNWKATVQSALPLGRFGEANDIAEAVNFLASQKSKYITGQRLFVDGGYSA